MLQLLHFFLQPELFCYYFQYQFFFSLQFHFMQLLRMTFLCKACSEEMRADWCQTVWVVRLGVGQVTWELCQHWCSQRQRLQLPFVCLTASSPGRTSVSHQKESSMPSLTAPQLIHKRMQRAFFFPHPSSTLLKDPFISKRYLFCLNPYL